MPLPAPLVGLTVRAKLLATDSTPIPGAMVVLTPTVPATSPSGDVLLPPKALERFTASDGTAEFTDVLATDSPGLSNNVPYTLTILDSSARELQSYTVQLLQSLSTGGVIRLDDVPESVAPITSVSYVLAASVGTVGGPAGPLDGSGKVPSSQLPVAGGSIASTIVDAKGDLIGATANDTPARVAVGSNGQVLIADSAQSTGLRWGVLTLTIADVSNLQTTLDGKVDESLLDVKGDLYAASAADTPARLAAGANGTNLMADSSQSTGLRWATRTTPAYDPAMDGLIAAVADPALFTGNSTLGNNGWAVRMLVPAGRVITGGLTCIHSAGTLGAGGVNGFAVNDDTGSLVSSTADDNNLWTATGARTKALSSPIAAQTTDRYVYVSLRVNGYSAAPGFLFRDGSAEAARLDGLLGGKRRSLTLGGTVWGSLDPVAGPSGGGYMPFLALY